MILKSNNFGLFEIIGDITSKYVDIKFIDTGYTSTVTKIHALNGEVKDYMVPVVCNIGYLGEKITIIRKHPLHAKLRILWKSMISRCYSDKHSSYRFYGGLGVYVDDEWLNYSNFFYDVISLPGFDVNMFLNGEITLDKDKIQSNNNESKKYSKHTCVWLSWNEQCDYKERDYSNHETLFKVKSPDGIIFRYSGIRKFARLHHLQHKLIKESMNTGNSYNGWNFYPLNNLHRY